MIQAQEGSVPLCTGWDTQCPQLYKKLSQQLNVVQYCSDKAYENGCIPKWHGLDDFEGLTEENKEYLLRNTTNYCTQRILNSNRAYVFIDGTILMPYSSGTTDFLIDINGKNGPNKWGYDIVSFSFAQDGENSLKIIAGPSSYKERGGIATSSYIQNMQKHK